MGTIKLRTFWSLTCLAVICLQCELISSEAPVTNYMSSYYDDAYHDGKSKSPGSPSPSSSHTYYPRHEADTEEEDDEEHTPHLHSHNHHGKVPGHRERVHEPIKHHLHNDEEYGNHEEYRQGPPPNPHKGGPYKSSGYYPKSKPYGLPKASYPTPTTGLPKYSLSTSGPSSSYNSGSNSRSAIPQKYNTIGSSFSSSTGPGYSYSYGTKVTEDGKEETEKHEDEPYGKYEESPPKDSYNMNHMNTYKGGEEEAYKGGYTAGYPPISPYNTVKGNYDDYGHNDLSPKSPYKPSTKPVTFSYSAPNNAEYGAPVDSPPGGNSYDADENSYTPSTYEKSPYSKPKGSAYSKLPFFSFKGNPKHSHSAPPPKYQGAPPKYQQGHPAKHYDGTKSHKTPPSSTYATISDKSYAKPSSYGYGAAPQKSYYPPSPSSSYGNYYTNKDYEYSRSPSTASVTKEYSPSSLSSPGSYSRGSPTRATSTSSPTSPNNPVRGGTFGRGKGVPKNAYRYSYTAFSMFNKKGRGRGHKGRGHPKLSLAHGHPKLSLAHGLAHNKQEYDYDGSESEEAEKQEQEALRNKRLFGSVGYSLGGARTFVKTPETNSNGYSSSANYGGGYDMGTSYY